MWNAHFNSLSSVGRMRYDPPEPFDLPSKRVNPGFLNQTFNHFRRCIIQFKRNIAAKLQETVVIVLGAIAVTQLDGSFGLTKDIQPDFDNQFFVLSKVNEDTNPFIDVLPVLFHHAISGGVVVVFYLQKLSLVLSLLVALSATKALTAKRVEFFREASSGYDITAYFLAVNVFTTLEVTFKMSKLCFPVTYGVHEYFALLFNFIKLFLLNYLAQLSWGLFATQ